MAYTHTTVLLHEAVDYWFTDPDWVYVDATLGGAGHSALLLSRLSARGKLFGLDQDPVAIRHAGERFAEEPRVNLLRTNFVALEDKLRQAGALPVHGILFDLGVSSPQLDEGERGFSYMRDAPLDMRMDPGRELTARDIVNSWSEDEIYSVIRRFGEEKWAKRIAGFIVGARAKHPLSTTGELVEVIKAAIPASARREGPHPAKRTFQALRIAVNDELGVLERALDQALRCLAPGGHLVVITFHSLEDRLVKEKMQSWLGKCTCPPGLPVCVCGAVASARLLNRKPVLPSATEIANNPRSRSAKLRAAEKVSECGGRPGIGSTNSS
ncbi:ribosomal RNA small subunit methyltransferase H [Peptococcaceae bacterium CEB3]|nr:ribosomal RNA small subunit methyltransferase H [Peptococcaceae bacterium CEB3]